MSTAPKLQRKTVPSLASKEAAPVIWGAGSVLWKLIAIWANIDFILSIREGKFATLFQAFLNYGWIVVAVVSAVWFFVNKRTQLEGEHRPMITAGTVLAGAGMAFLFGVLLTVYSSGTVEQPFVAWGGGIDDCIGTADTSRMQGFQSKYDLAMICVLEDPRVDKFYDTRIAISAPFRIVPGSVTMQAKPRNGNLTSEFLTSMLPPNAQLAAPDSTPPPGTVKTNVAVNISVSRFAILIPRGRDLSNIKRLADVEDQGGRILSPLYYH